MSTTDVKPQSGTALRTALRRSRLLYFLLGACVSLAAAAAILLWVRPARFVAARTPVWHCQAGPWGDVSYVKVELEIPKAWTSLEAYTGAPTQWFFDDLLAAQVEEFFRSAGLSAEQIRTLMIGASIAPDGQGTMLMPSADAIINLAPSARSYIYSALARYPRNTIYREPHRFLSANLRRWLDQSGLPPRVTDVVRRLMYESGRAAVFSDVNLALSQANTYPEKQALLQLLSRQVTLMPALQIGPDTQTEALAEYWGRGGRHNDVLSLLDSVKRQEGGGSVDLVYLLPPFVRERIYTYPRKTAPVFPDCHYTSMNFFYDPPDERFADIAFVRRAVTSDYVLVQSDFRLGDLILLRAPDNEVLHSCNYIADDIVFTKNGGSRGRAWTLMNLADLLELYSVRGPVDMRVLRLRD